MLEKMLKKMCSKSSDVVSRWIEENYCPPETRDIYEVWKEKWKSVEGFNEKEAVFYPVFIKTYEDTCIKEERNKDKNKFWKRTFIIVMILGFVTCLTVFLYKTFKLPDNGNISMPVFLTAGLFLFWVLGFYMIQKWLDIKKYQETWIRHSDHKYALQREMMKYILGLGEYENGNREKTFMKNTLEIWEKNQKKFSDNMNNKEVLLIDSSKVIEKITK